jgi:hypothetical protein
MGDLNFLTFPEISRIKNIALSILRIKNSCKKSRISLAVIHNINLPICKKCKKNPISGPIFPVGHPLSDGFFKLLNPMKQTIKKPPPFLGIYMTDQA